jgi:hypothetical protein
MEKDQFITKADLENFRLQLLEDMKKLLQPPPSPSPKQWLKSAEVRALLKISSGKLDTLRASGKLPSSKIGSVHYYKYDDIQKLLNPDM